MYANYEIVKKKLEAGEVSTWRKGERLGNIIGSGGSGLVCDIIDESGQIKSVLKIVSFKEDEDGNYGSGRVEEEVKRLEMYGDCPNAVNVYWMHVFQEEKILIFKMEKLQDLKGWLKRCYPNNLIPEREVLNIGVQLLNCLNVMALQGEVHRDIKPENIFVDMKRGFPEYKLGDFGIAIAENSGKTMGRGSEGYLAYEAALGRPCVKSDQFSLAATMYTMLNEMEPYDTSEYYEDIMRKKIYQLPYHGSAELRDILKKAMALNPEDRFDTPKAMSQALQKLESYVVAGGRTMVRQPVKAPARPLPPQAVYNAPPQKKKKHVWGWVLGVGTAGACMIGVMFFGVNAFSSQPLDEVLNQGSTATSVSGSVLDGNAIATIKENCRTVYRDNLFAEAQSVYETDGADAAINILSDGYAVLGEDTALTEKIEYYESLKPVSMVDELDPSVGDEYNLYDAEGETDNTGNSGYRYHKDIGYSWGGVFDDNNELTYALNGEYTRLECTVALPSEEANTDMYGWIEFYDGDRYLGESEHLTRGSRPYTCSIDVTGVQELTIKFVKESPYWIGTTDLLIDDFILYK